MLLAERARIVTAMQKLGEFSDTATKVVNATKDDLVHNLTNLEPTLKALADVGPDLGTVLAYLPTFPLGQNFIDRAIRGDYINIFASIDLTVPRLKRSLFLGTRWGDPNAELTPAPGDPAALQLHLRPAERRHRATAAPGRSSDRDDATRSASRSPGAAASRSSAADHAADRCNVADLRRTVLSGSGG